MRTRFFFVLTLALAALSVRADDWPNWRGPNHNGISKESDWLTTWPQDGPRRLWKASVGIGFSSVSVSKGRAYTMGNKDDSDTVFCFDADTGKVVWQYSYPCPLDAHYYEGGTSATPTVDGNFVYTLSKKGNLYCFKADTGDIVWSKDLARELGLEAPTWGFASSALIQGDRLFLNAGTQGVAFDKATGKVLWTTGKAACGYSSPVPCLFLGKTALAFESASGAVAVEQSTGKTIWQYPWKANYEINAADPIIDGNKVFVSSTYGNISALLDIENATPTVFWSNKNLCNQINSSVLVDGFLYGIDGIAGPTPRGPALKCVDWKTGTVKWSFPEIGGGALMVAGGQIIALSDKGELFVGRASSDKFVPASNAQVLGGRCWTMPVLANARIYCRNARGDLVCLDVRSR